MLCSILTMLLLYLLAGLDMISSYTLFDIKMPNVSPKEDESYLCTGKKLPRTRDRYYAYKFEPNADEKTAHHMLVYACRSLSKRNRHNAYWKCHGTPCSGGQIIYAWAKNAEGLTLPKHVGFPLGDDFDLNYIVQQIHYARPLQDFEYDSSGVKIRLTKYEPQFVASIYLFASNFQIPPNSKGYNVDMACKYRGDSIKPFAFRTHAHKHGRSISAYRVRDGVWDQIGIGSPQRPQAFYPIKKEDRLLLKSNDLLVARCTFDTMNETKTIRAGSYSSDEMCNFYMMYYTMNKGEDFSVPSGCSSTTHTLDFPKDSMLPLQSSSTNTQPQTTPVASTAKPSTQKPEPKISSTPTDPHSKAAIPSINTTKAHFSTHSESSHSSDLPELDSSWSVEKELRSSFKGQIRSMDVTLDDKLVVLTGVRPANNSLFDGEHFLLESKPIEEKTIYIVHSNDGSLFNSFGANVFYLPSSVRVDQQGHFYVTDLGRHQVLKFDPLKKDTLKFVLGQEGIPGEDRNHFCSPTDVVVDHNDHIYVADGLCNNRIVKFDANGKYLSEFGSGHLKHPQHLAISGHHIYVATQNRDQIYVFDFDGKFIRALSHGLSTNEISMVYCHAKDSKDELLYIGGKNKVVAINLQKDSSIAWQIKGTGDKVLALSRDHRYLYIGDKDNGDIQRYLLPSSTSKNKGKNNFPWSPIDQIPSSTKPSTNNNSSRQVDILPKTPYDDDDITVIPAVVVVAVLATPIILVFVALIIQHVRLKHRVKRAAQKRTLDNYTKTGICTCCWSTPKYYYDSQKGFDRLVKGFNEDDDANEELSSSGEEDLFTRKA